MSEEYLNIKQLEARIPYKEKAIRKIIAKGVWVCGVHYNRPAGPRKKIMFFWSAIEAWVRGDDYEFRRRHLERQSKGDRRATGAGGSPTMPSAEFAARRRELLSRQRAK